MIEGHDGTNRRDDGRGTFFSLSRRWLAIAVVGLALAVLGVGATSDLANGAGLFGGHGRHHGGWSADERAEHVKLAVEWALRWVDATSEQEQRVAAILEAQLPVFEALAARHRESHPAVVAALAGEQVDRAALEAVRISELALAEEASQQLVAVVADVAEVLTAEQRAELARLAERFHGFHD
jgi:Spy/CpxP family protein refolding chaperone